MIIKRSYILGFLLIAIHSCYCQSSEMLTVYERNCLSIFNDLKSAIALRQGQNQINNEKARNEILKKSSSGSKQLSNDSEYLNEIVHRYFLLLYDNSDDSSIAARTNSVLSQFNNFNSFFVGKSIEEITVTPLRLCKDRYVYQRLSPFQKQNTFALIDKHHPDNILTYLLFIPGELIKTKTPKIMSWTLGFALGIYYFEDLLGKKGMEFLFDGKGLV